MARIPVEVVERLKTQVSVQRLAEARGVAFKKHQDRDHRGSAERSSPSVYIGVKYRPGIHQPLPVD
jgi:hypothetical protein